jgi:hypothetical protein
MRVRQARMRERFAALREQFAWRYEAALAVGDGGLVEPEWHERNRALEADVLPAPPEDFLRHPSILYSMFMPERCVDHELPLLVERFGDGLPELLAEDPVGRPPLIRGHDGSYDTSSNSVHQLFHLARFGDASGVDVPALDTVVEWGAGYGAFAKLLRRLHGGAPTYIAIDTPLFACIQWLYLASVLGPDAVHLMSERGEPVTPGKVTLVPSGLAAELDVQAHLFVSNWALNESVPAAQDLVRERAWYRADHLLLAMHDGAPLAGRAIADGARKVPVGDFLPGQRYLVR